MKTSKVFETFEVFEGSEAEPLYRRALEICEKALGKDHPDAKTVRKNLESLLKKKVTIQAFCHRGHKEHRDIKKFLIKSQIQGYKALNALHEVVDTPKSSSVTSVVSVAE